MIKLIVWDLDDTLWEGTLAEGDDVKLIDTRIEMIRVLNSQGVVHSVCSKNDPSTAAEKLNELGISGEFVFNEIAFRPKGQSVRKIIQDMNLRAPDVAFIDDNPLNLAEVADACPGIQTIDARSAECDLSLERFIEETVGGTSRQGRYRILESRRSDMQSLNVSNEEFLRSCDISVTLIRNQDCLLFADRIESLINRTNQLNFLKSRVKEGTLASNIVDTSRFESYAAFVTDKYGDHGLVGFAMISRPGNLTHLTFSCRIMDMGVETALTGFIDRSTTVDWAAIPVAPGEPDWISLKVESDSGRLAELANSHDGGSEEFNNSRVRVMANCQSAAIAHFMRTNETVDFDNYPRTFNLSGFWKRDEFPGEWREIMIYGAFVHYDNHYWPRGILPTRTDFLAAASHFVKTAEKKGARIIAILPPEDFSNIDPTRGRSREQFYEKNGVWRELAKTNEFVDVLEISEFKNAQGITDPRHYSRELLMEIAEALDNLISI